MIFLLALACAVHVDNADSVDAVPIESDTPSTDTPTDSDPPAALTAHIEPAAPNWDDDLKCIPSIDLPDDYTIKWTVNGNDFTDAMGTFYRGDTVPHLRQAGGQTWSCAIFVDETTATSASAFVQPIVPMVMLPPGQFRIGELQYAYDIQRTFRLTRPFWIATHEFTWSQWDQYTTRPPYRESKAPTQAVSNAGDSRVAALTNLLSELDGVTPCYSCTGDVHDEEVSCNQDTPQLYDCTGYRMPTQAEWDYAASAGGQHEDPLPAGGIWAYDPYTTDTEYLGLSTDPPVIGPNAPLGTTLRDQCWQGAGVTDVQAPGLTIPNALGIYDMCGNAAELVSGNLGRSVNGDVDPLGRTFGGMGGGIRSMPLGRWASAGGGGGLRLARTNTPLPPPASTP